MKEITPEFLKKNAFVAARWTKDGKLIAVIRLTFGRGRLVVGDEVCYEKGY
jgi:hypothetical protein